MSDRRAWFERCKTSDVPEEVQWLTPERAWIEGYKAAIKGYNDDFKEALKKELTE